jgi:nucleoid DNA-binding protein
LNPIKRRQLTKETAEKLNLSTEMVDDLVSCYYDFVQKKLTTLSHAAILVPKLGTFVIKKKSLAEAIKKTNYFILKLEAEEDISVKTYELILRKKAELKKLKEIQAFMQEEEDKKLLIKKQRQHYKDEKPNSNLEGEE